MASVKVEIDGLSEQEAHSLEAALGRIRSLAAARRSKEGQRTQLRGLQDFVSRFVSPKGLPVITDTDIEDAGFLEDVLAVDESLRRLMEDAGRTRVTNWPASLTRDRMLNALAQNRKVLDRVIQALEKRLASRPKSSRP